jgi:SAM-dependent methyltransferase
MENARMTADPVAEHYDKLLAQHYTWMFGDTFDEKVSEQRALLEGLGVAAKSSPTGTAIDLGCGSGFQSVALAGMGFSRIVAVDTSAKLLAELQTRGTGRPIQTVQGDLAALAQFAEPQSADVVICMGDTLTHLSNKNAVSKLFADAHRVLAPGGLLVLTFRDLTSTMSGLDRFNSVRSDADRIMTCFLESESAATIVVHDLIHVRNGSAWTLHKSSYRKLRLAPDWVCGELAAAGFRVQRNEAAGRLWAITASK